MSPSGNNLPAFPASRCARVALHAFSLIELLVVIGVIVILAGLSFPAMNAVKATQARNRTRAELSQIETAIETYKTKLGFYPPDNPLTATNWFINQLYYELRGTTKSGTLYQTLDGSAQITDAPASFQAAFGSSSTTKLTGFMNCAKAGAGDDAPNAVNFLTGLKPGQFLAVTSPVKSTVLGVSLGGSPVFTGANNSEIVPYGYNSSSPIHNARSFDLWVDIIVGGKTNRICNWSTRPIFVYYPSLANAYY
jgi:prepilin-type N-terminal cleavage/methylation domain-containing protein